MRSALPVAIALVACDLPPAEVEHPVETGPRWIAIDSDAIATVNGALAHAVDGVEGVAIVEVDAEDLHGISQRMHRQHHRCGGFVLHASLDAATRSLNARAFAGREDAPAAPTYTIDNAAGVAALLPALSEANVLGLIQDLSARPTRYYTAASGVAAATWLRDTWQGFAAGRSGVTVELFEHGWPQRSVIATIPGTVKPDEVIVIGGHLDSISPGGGNAPGADDDASGIATLSEVFRALMAVGWQPERTVKFMAYAAEEVGLRGSDDIASDFEARGVTVVGALQLDMTNYKGSARDIYFVSDYTSSVQNAFLGQLVDTYLAGTTWSTTQCGYACSDHASWYRAGYRVSMPSEARFSESNTEIHTPYDTLDVSDGSAAHAFKFARLAAAFVAELGKGAPANREPSVDIVAPAASSRTVALSGTAGDPEDGDLSAQLAWTSSVDGALGSGAAIEVTLTPGMHAITAAVTDSRGASGSRTVMLVVRDGDAGGGDDGEDGGAGGCSARGGAGLLVGVALLARRRRRRE